MRTDAVITRTVIQRFKPARIAEHGLYIVLFGVLVITGLSQKYYGADVSLWLIVQMGGIDVVRMAHRWTGLLFTFAVAAHLGAAFFGIVVRRWQPTLIISRKDIEDAVHNVRYYIGLEDRPAAGGRYTYEQKFEYWGILTGGLLMVLSGAFLWKPALATRFLPGETIPAAKVLHSNEALVVLLIIAGWHVYNAIFSPAAFPMNMSIFTGTISRERMKEDHLLELARIEGRSPDEVLREDARDHEAGAVERPASLPAAEEGGSPSGATLL